MTIDTATRAYLSEHPYAWWEAPVAAFVADRLPAEEWEITIVGRIGARSLFAPDIHAWLMDVYLPRLGDEDQLRLRAWARGDSLRMAGAWILAYGSEDDQREFFRA